MECSTSEQVEIHGGSFRVFVTRKGRPAVTPEIPRLLRRKRTGWHDRQTLDAFGAP